MKTFSLYLLTSLLCLQAVAQKEWVLKGTEAHKRIPGAEVIRIRPHSPAPNYIQFRQGKGLTEAELPLFAQKFLFANDMSSLSMLDTQRDQLGFVHQKYQQLYGGLPVEGSRYIAHLKGGEVLSLNGLVIPAFSLSLSPTLSETDALQQALNHIGAEVYKWELEAEESFRKETASQIYAHHPDHFAATYYPSGQLVIAPAGGDFLKGDFRLAYKFDIYAHQPLSRSYIFVDAHSGEVIWQLQRLHTADAPGTAETKYSGTQPITTDNSGGQYRLRESGRGNGIITLNMQRGTNFSDAVDFTDADNFWNNFNEQEDEVATDAHFAAERTYDYFLEKFGRNSMDGAGLPLVSYVHYDDNYTNAFWNGEAASFGDGAGNFSPLTTLDICAHEYTHGLTDFTAGLIYQNESGALNESFSDIFGTAIEHFVRGQEFNWLIGEEIGRNLRSMSNPNSRNDPDTYQGDFWFVGSGDNGGVHINSGVQNFWFYLLANGGSGTNDHGHAFQVSGIGMEEAAAIAYRNLTVYLTPTSDYADARFFADLSAAELFGACSPQAEACANAWYAAGVGQAYRPEVLAGFLATPLTDCKAPMKVAFTNTSLNANSFTWDFGDGQSSNEIFPVHTYQSEGSYTVTLTVEGGECGSDVLSVQSFVNISADQPCVVLLSDDTPVQTACEGLLYDTGGPFENYPDEQNHVLTLAPQHAHEITLEFSEFDFEWDYDYLYIYEGTDTTGRLIGRYTGTLLPEEGRITIPSGAVTLRQFSDRFVNGNGFALKWTCSIPEDVPQAAFRSTDTLSCNGQVQFEDLSQQATQWIWDFGDGNTSSLRNPQHTYEQNGTYSVQLQALNHLGATTATKTAYITVERPAPPAPADQLVCGAELATLQADAGEGVLYWYDSTGNFLGEGPQLEVNVPTGSSRFLAEKRILAPIQAAGPPSPSFGSGGFHDNSSTQYLIFDALEEIQIVSVLVRSNVFKDRKIMLWDANDRVLDSAIVRIESGLKRIELDFRIPAGSGYKIGGTQMGLYRNNSGPEYPYVLEDVLSITGSSAGEDYYYYFYDWEVRGAPCISLQVPLEVISSEGPPPVANFDYSQQAGELAFTNRSFRAQSWLWNFGDGSTSNERDPIHRYQENGTFEAKLIAFNGPGCTDTMVQMISVSGVTDLQAGGSPADIRLFPNPGNGDFQLWVQPAQAALIRLQIFNALGQSIYATQPEKLAVFRKRIQLTDAPAGTYWLRISIDGQQYHRPYLLR
ncbi:MAG: PKD domain-containing protein [Bacteroidetes bacterium]|nr:MAG: PKD domain-containing protein [Bacteroidota bacterium]